MKLTEEEQEQMKLENYKMMSAISGKNLNDFIGNSAKNNYNEKDCMIKLMYLKNMVNPISSSELYNVLKSQGYNRNNSTFRVMLNQYQKYEYVQKVTDKKPFLYQITELGNQHIKNPYLAREKCIRRYKEFQLQELKKIIENYPELFKSIYESIHGTQISPFSAGNVAAGGSQGGSQYSPNDLGSDLQQELESQIFTSDFKNADEQKLKALVDGILDNSLSDEQKKELILDAITQSRKNTIKITQPEYNSKPIGDRQYYPILVSAINELVTKSVYEAIPFRFIQVGNELRLESESIAGKYRNNQDGKPLGFDYVNFTYFRNRMTIKTKPNPEKRELEFYYVGAYKPFEITTMSCTDYKKVKNVKQETLTIITN